MQFQPSNTAGRERVRICGRGLFLTNSASVELSSSSERDVFPLVPFALDDSELLPDGLMWVFPIEADGFLFLADDAGYSFYEAQPFSSFDYKPNTAAQVRFYTPPVPVKVIVVLTVGYTPYLSPNVYYRVYNLRFDDGTEATYTRALSAPPPPVGASKAEITRLYEMVPYDGDIYPFTPQ